MLGTCWRPVCCDPSDVICSWVTGYPSLLWILPDASCPDGCAYVQLCKAAGDVASAAGLVRLLLGEALLLEPGLVAAARLMVVAKELRKPVAACILRLCQDTMADRLPST